MENYATDIAQIAIQNFLLEKIDAIRAKNPAFSLRAFARKLGIHSPALSEILGGRRKISKKLLARFAKGFPEDSAKIAELAQLFPSITRASASRTSGKRPPSLRIDADRFHAIADWYHFGILSLAETPHFKSDPKWIAATLQIGEKEAKEALKRLLRMGLLETSADGHAKTKGISYTTTDGVANLSVRRGHAQNIELARKSLDEDPVDVRDFTAITMAIDPAKLPTARKMIRAFRDDLCAFLEGGDKLEVYKLCLQLFPLSHSPKDGQEGVQGEGKKISKPKKKV